MNHLPPFSEVIESCLSGWKAQSWEWDSFPAFGSLVTIKQGERTIFGVIYEIQSGSLDPLRYPFAYKKTEEELKKEQPQIFEFLKTTLSCLTVGYEEHSTIYYQLAPEPPKIHAFVYPASSSTYQTFFSDYRYLQLLFNYPHLPIALDELLLAMLKHHHDYWPYSQDTIIELLRNFSLLTANDYRRLKLFLQRLQIILTKNPNPITQKTKKVF